MIAISLNFENNFGMYFFVFLILPLVFFYKAKIQNFVHNNTLTLSKTTNQQLQGLFIILVIVHHISQKIQIPGLMQVFWYIGFLAVGAFFFISGVGLTKSLKIKENYLNGFLQKKLVRIFLPFLIVNTITLLGFYINNVFFPIGTLIEYLLGIKLIDGTLWFVQTIMLFYFFFYISFYKTNNFQSLIIVTLLVLSYMGITYFLDMGPQTYVSTLCFLLGIYYVFYEEKINSLISHNFFKLLLLSLFLFLTFLLLQQKIRFLIIFTPVFFVAFVFILFLKVKPMSYVFHFLGNISLEMYLIHIKILLIFSFFTKMDSGIWIILYLSSVTVCAYVFAKFNSILHKKFLLVFTQKVDR